MPLGDSKIGIRTESCTQKNHSFFKTAGCAVYLDHTDFELVAEASELHRIKVAYETP